jgi:hypothetical protein
VRDDLNDLLNFYAQARADGGDFETGIRFGIQGILANPRFVFRMEQAPQSANDVYRLTDIDLASRLSFFLWGTLPDQELLKVAGDGTLRNPTLFEKQVKRMLADPRSQALSTRFAAQWLRLQDVEKVRPDGLLYPNWDVSLTDGFVRETELFFDSIVRENRSVMDLLNAGLHVRERAAGAALRHSERHRSRIPSRDTGRTSPWSVDARQRAAADFSGRPDVAGTAR